MRPDRRPRLVVPVPLDVLHAMRARRRTAMSDREWRDVLHGRLATRQEGIVGRDQLPALGFDRGVIARRVKAGALIRQFRGVYAVGHEALTFRARAIAAPLAIGDDAVLSHETAAHLWALLPTQPPCIDVTTRLRRPRSRPGLTVHRRDIEVTRKDGLAVTTPEQTLAHLTSHPRIASMTSEALYLRLIAPEAAPADAPTRSELERRMLRLITRSGLERPVCQHPVGPYTADFLWPAERVIVETDGWDGHRHELAFHRDRRRDAWLLAHGYVVIRFTWPQLRDEPLTVIARVAAVLAHRGALDGTPHRVVPHPPPGG